VFVSCFPWGKAKKYLSGPGKHLCVFWAAGVGPHSTDTRRKGRIPPADRGTSVRIVLGQEYMLRYSTHVVFCDKTITSILRTRT